MVLGLFRKPSRSLDVPRGAAGARAYAIGDVHGRLDLLHALLERIAADSAARPCDREYIVFLGDLVDRGPDSRGVIDYLMRARDSLPNPVFLMGNHEEMLLRILESDTERVWDWLSYGGFECAQSYGVDTGRLTMLKPDQICAQVRAAVPDAHRVFLESFADTFRFGDYLFVHAGVRPAVALEDQAVHDMHWIRDEFLESTVNHGFIVVHGHTVTDGPDTRPNRIGIDTGAYASGVLTALCIEGTDRRFLTASANDI